MSIIYSATILQMIVLDPLGHNNMGSWQEKNKRGEDGVQSQTQQAEPVNHHRRKLPVRNHFILFVFISQSFS